MSRVSAETDMNDAGSKVRVAVIGLGAAGRLQTERFLFRPEFTAALTWDSDPARTALLPRSVPHAASQEELLAADVDVVFIALDGPQRTATVLAALSAGKHVALEPPVAETPSDVRAIVDAAATHGPIVHVLNPRALDADFRQALAAARDDGLGALRHVHFTAWGPPPISRDRDGKLWPHSPEDGAPGDLLQLDGAALIDLLVQVIDDTPRSVRCVLTPATHGPFLNGGDLFLEVDFNSGARARIDLNRRTCLTEPAGWIVSGSNAAYRRGKLHRVTSDGEIFEVSVDPVSAAGDSLEDELLARLRQPVTTPATRLVRAAAILEAARRSALMSERVDLDPARSKP